MGHDGWGAEPWLCVWCVQKGESIRKLKHDANADIVIEEYVNGSEDRIISINMSRDSVLHTPTSGGDALIAVFEKLYEAGRDCVQGLGSDEEIHTRSASTGSADDASMMEEEPCTSMDDCTYEVRLLVDTCQVGYLVGKSGSAIKASVEESGADIRVMSKGELPTCARVSDEMIQITGSREAVIAALRRLAYQLELHPPRHYRNMQKKPMLLAHASTGDLQYLNHSSTRSCSDLSIQGANSSIAVDTIFRLLVPAERVGTIIGRGGDHIKRIRSETGGKIKVYGSADEVEERLICVYSSEDAGSQYCAAQDALVRCAISLSSDDNSSRSHVIRLLAPQVSIGSVIGRKGATVLQLRQETGASIRVLSVEAPLAAAAAVAIGGGEPGGDEIIHIEGALHQSVAALRGIATLLRSWQIRRAFTATPRAVTTITLAPGLLAQSLAMGAANGGLVAVPVTASGAGSPAAYATVAHGSFPTSPPVLWRYRLNNLQAGAVIGRGGHHVAQIRQLTGTRVHLPSGQSPDGLRTLEISGPEESCQAAHTLVNQFLAVSKCPPVMPEHQSNAMIFVEGSEASPESDSQMSPSETDNSEMAYT